MSSSSWIFSPKARGNGHDSDAGAGIDVSVLFGGRRQKKCVIKPRRWIANRFLEVLFVIGNSRK